MANIPMTKHTNGKNSPWQKLPMAKNNNGEQNQWQKLPMAKCSNGEIQQWRNVSMATKYQQQEKTNHKNIATAKNNNGNGIAKNINGTKYRKILTPSDTDIKIYRY